MISPPGVDNTAAHVGNVEVLSYCCCQDLHPPFIAVLQCQAAHTLPDCPRNSGSDSRPVDHRVLPPADNGSNPVAPNLTDAPSPYIPAALLPPVALALASSVVATTLNTPTHCYEWLPCLAPHPHAGKRLKTVTEEGGRGVAG